MIVNGASGTMSSSSSSLLDTTSTSTDPTGTTTTITTTTNGTTILTCSSNRPRRRGMKQWATTRFCTMFPLWTVLTAWIALIRPHIFIAIPSATFPYQIGLLMLCMGITLQPIDFQRSIIQSPKAIGLAFIGCYGLMPVLAYSLGRLLQLDKTLAAGLLLVSSINGAQASNLCTYIGHGDLALSILMTTCTTIGAIVMTPLVIHAWLGKSIVVNGWAMALSTCQVVLVPILFGMAVNTKFPKFVQVQILPYSPTLGVLITCLLVGTSVAGCANPIRTAGWSLQLSALLLHGAGGLIGYLSTRPFYTERIARTFAIQLAMKSSAFGYLLAMLHFGPEYAVPSAVSIVWMTIIGSTLAVVSRLCPPSPVPATAAVAATTTTTIQ